MALNSDQTAREVILKFSCADQPGIVAAVATFFRDQGFNIRESSQFEDRKKQRFFMRTGFEYGGGECHLADLRARFAPVGEHYDMHWEIWGRDDRPRIVVAVSNWGHCLNGLLNSWKRGSLPAEIVAVVSNHQTMRDMVEWYGLPYFYFPVDQSAKPAQEARILQLFQELDADLLVLARYMQILSDELCAQLPGRAINIHHSFLPGFKGARPYHQAYDRGVKLIGATAHYVTPDLDEGPIIEQAVERVTHAHSPEQLVEIGRDIEALVLQRAVRWHCEHRVLLNGSKTVVFNP